MEELIQQVSVGVILAVGLLIVACVAAWVSDSIDREKPK